jgi:sulfate transport system permease protein
MSIEAVERAPTPPNDGGRIDLRRTDNADARRGRRVRALMVAPALLYVAILLLAPLGVIVYSAPKSGLGTVARTFIQHNALHALYLTFLIMLVTVIVTAVFGVIVALVLARDRFPGRRLVSAVVDLPLAISPVIVGLAAVLRFGRGGWFEPFLTAHGIQVIFALPSMVLVTVFISIPFVIREVVPVPEELGTEEEQAARTLGASRLQAFIRVTLPNIRWGLLYGIALSAARAIGEVGAVYHRERAIQGHTETATLYILRLIDQSHATEAYVVALTLALFSILLLLGIELVKRRRIREVG